MSRWVDGTLDLRCSIDVLVKELIKIKPQWEKYILVDPEGKIEMYRYRGEKRQGSTCHVLIPGYGRPTGPKDPSRMSDNDWGFFKNSEGVWETRFCDHRNAAANEMAENIVNSVKGQISLQGLQKLGVNIEGLQVGEEEISCEFDITDDKYRELVKLLA